MKLFTLCSFLFFVQTHITAQQCRFEKSAGKESATYFEAIDWYKKLDRISSKVLVKEMGATDAGYPLHLVLVSADGKFSPQQWYKENKVVILVNNGIHPGEPDGIDASMMLVRDIVRNKLTLPDNIVLAFIPVYNIGGCLNRGTSSRANQNGPLEYGFRGNAQNLDLNRDFTKCDSKEAKSFTQLFQWLGPDIFIDNHVSDGADYQHTFTLIATQYDKLGAGLGKWLKDKFEPELYKGMSEKKWDICPYVNFETASPDNGMEMFYDPPRYSSGYAALFQTIAFVPETHMLKPFKDRVLATYAFMQTLVEKAAANASTLIKQREAARDAMMLQQEFPLSWKVDSTQFSYVRFKGYEAAQKKSEVTEMDRLYYDHNKPFDKEVKYYNVFTPTLVVKKPKAYIIPQGWYSVIELMKLNGVKIQSFTKDTLITVEAYHIDEYKSYNRPYEKHHKNHSVKVSSSNQTIQFLKGDHIVYLDQTANRYIVEMLEPQGDDSFFAWNFFDAILQQKEGYSDYRWEDIAAEVLKKDLLLQKELQDKKLADTVFAADASAQLEFVYKHSPYYEPVHLRYPVFRLVQ
jgi:hypothetical protein